MQRDGAPLLDDEGCRQRRTQLQISLDYSIVLKFLPYFGLAAL